MPTKWIANFNSWGSTFNIIGLFVVIIMIPASVTGTATSPKFMPSKQVWAIQNGTEWPDGVAVLMSFIAIIWTMSGYGMFPTISSPSITQTNSSRRPIPPLRRMRKRLCRLPPCHRHDIRLRRLNGLGSPTRRRLHRNRHPIRNRFRSRPTMGLLPRPNHASEDRPRNPRPHHCLRLLHGPRLHGRCVQSHVRLCPR